MVGLNYYIKSETYRMAGVTAVFVEKLKEKGVDTGATVGIGVGVGVAPNVNSKTGELGVS